MWKFKSTLLIMSLNLFITLVYADIPQISGEIYQVINKKEKKIKELRFTVMSMRDPKSKVVVELKDGLFSDVDLDEFLVGERAKIIMSGNYWKVIEPLKATFTVPQDDNRDPLIIKVIENSLYKSSPINGQEKAIRKKVIIRREPVYSVQIFSGTSRDKALFALYNLIDKGYTSAFITRRVMADNTLFYHIYTGKYQRKERANEVRRLINKSKYFKAYREPFVVKIKDPS